MKFKKALKIFLIFVLVLLMASPILASTGDEKASFGLISILPPLIAILLSFITKQVLLSLFLGVLVGVTMLQKWNVFYGFLRSLDTYIVGAVADKWHAGILIFTLSIGGMIGIVAKMGGTHAIAEALAKKAKTAKGAQVVTWLLGLIVFFDDYANTLIVGPTMRPLTDKMKVSREKLSYIVDATAAPVAGLALISTWVGYELGVINDAFSSIGMKINAYEYFIKSIPYRFYDIFTILMVLLIALMARDFGPMFKAEKRARLEGKPISDTARPMASMEIDSQQLKEGLKPKMRNAIVPVLTLVIIGFVGLWYSGNGLDEPFTLEGIRTAFGNSDASIVLVWASIIASIVAGVMAISQKILTLGETFDAWIDGAKSLILTVMILTMAWSLGAVTNDVGTANYLVGALSQSLPYTLLPIFVFLISGVISFATGTSWGTMAIMMPLAIPLANAMQQNGAPASLIFATMGTVLTGAIFGDHCSPISDTTIMSSMASASDHMDHVNTQMPYALTVFGVSLVFGYLPVAFGIPVWIGLIIGGVAVWAILRFFGKSTDFDKLKIEEDKAALKN